MISYIDILFVGCGDSSIESALLLADQNRVTLSYRGEKFGRLKPKNAEDVLAAEKNGRIKLMYNSNVLEIKHESVVLSRDQESNDEIPNQLVYIFAGGELPTDFLKGLDFRIAKTSKGGFADYSTSKWSRRERALSDVEKAAIDSHGLFDLSGFLPKKPTDVELKVMKEMFEASVDGEAYDMDRWGQYFKPAGMGQATGDPNKVSVRAPVVDEDADDGPAPKAAPVAPAAPAATAEGASRAQDILAMIRNRQKQ